jgi:MoaA/NifB/PqqE/SkfB family radical SAM enzyme
MITLRTITTIELSNACSLSCPYCVNRLMRKHGREYGIMDEATFERSLYWLQMLCDLGTQKEVNLNGNGESLLDPQIPERIRRVKDIMGERRVCM